MIFTSKPNKLQFELSDFEKNLLSITSITSYGYRIRINCNEPFELYLEIDKIEKIKNFKNCRKIVLNNLQLNDNDIAFLNNDTLLDLKELNLDRNKITNLNFIDNIKSKQLQLISIKDNLINKGIEIINNNKLFLNNLHIIIKSYNKNKYLISLKYSGIYDLYFDYLLDKDRNFDIFNNINFRKNFLILSGLKLKNIDFMVYKSMGNLWSICLDDNDIEDISIFEKIDYHIGEISLKQNSIRKGLHVLKNNYFKCLYIELEIIKTDNEYKICSDFICGWNKLLKIEFYIKDINELKDILDIKNAYIELKKKPSDELKLLESEFLQNQSDEQKELFEKIKLLRYCLKEHKTIDIIRGEKDFRIIDNYNILFINDNTYKLLEKLFLYFSERVDFYSNIDINLRNLLPEDEKLIQNLSFIHMNKLKIINSNININILKELHIKSLDLSESSMIDLGIKELKELRENIDKVFIKGDKPCVIIDNGTIYCRAGLRGEEVPRIVFPFCVGYLKNTNNVIKRIKTKFFIGDEAEARRGILKLNYPIEHGIINNWDEAEEIWNHVFNKLVVDPVEQNIILTEPPMNPKEKREHMAQIAFETFNVPRIIHCKYICLVLI